MIWVIYISAKSNSQKNFKLGLNKKTWGFKNEKACEDIKTGDVVFFISALSWLKSEGNAPNGFSRVNDIHDFRGMVRKIFIAEVTKGAYFDSSTLWDDDSYPYRFDFKKNDELNNVLFGTEFFNNEFVESAFKSSNGHGIPVIVNNVDKIKDITNYNDNYINDSAREGRPIYKIHKYRERNGKLVRNKKEKVLLENGKLECEVCSFDFHAVYGASGDGYAECHHINPLSLRSDNEDTSLDDLAILCANCHRIIHRTAMWLSIDELKKIYLENKKAQVK